MPLRSPFPDIRMPTLPLTDYVFEHIDRYPDRPAMIDGPTGRTLTYRQLRDAIQHCAAGLQQRGIGKGDVVAVHLPNCPEYAVIFYAVAAIGATNTTVNPLLSAAEVHTQLVDAGARMLVTVAELADRAREGSQGTKVTEIVCLSDCPETTPFAALLANDGKPAPVNIDPINDVVVLPYSSGTTGLPKGVMLTHFNLAVNVEQTAAVEPITGQDVLIAVLPFYHIYGMVVIMSLGLRLGATVVTMPRFDFANFLQLLQDYHVTRAYLVPPIILALTKHPLVDNYDLSALQVVISGAAPLGGELVAACSARLGCFVKQAYGLTEMSPVATLNSDDPARAKAASVGQMVPNTEVRAVDLENGQDVGPNEPGELWFRGPQNMLGYLNNPAATAEMLDPDGWLHTGDVGIVDEDGFITIVDRIKEMIKFNAYQVAPAELEAVLCTHPAVADAAVIPSRDAEHGEVPKAYIVLKGEASADDLMEYVAGRVAPYKKVRRVEFVDQIPKSSSGKILRRMLIERDRAGA